MRTSLTVAVLLALLAASAGVALWAWRAIGEVEISLHGMVALTLGVVVTFVLGAGLMALVFFSNRRGYDDQAYRPEDPPPGQGDDTLTPMPPQPRERP